MNYLTLAETVHNKVLRARALERLVESPLFERLWGVSLDNEKKAARECIDKLWPDKLKDWITYHPKREPEEMGFKELVLVAQRRCIKGYSRMVKTELIRAIKNDQSTTDRTDCITDTGDEADVPEGEH